MNPIDTPALTRPGILQREKETRIPTHPIFGRFAVTRSTSIDGFYQPHFARNAPIEWATFYSVLDYCADADRRRPGGQLRPLRHAVPLACRLCQHDQAAARDGQRAAGRLLGRPLPSEARAAPGRPVTDRPDELLQPCLRRDDFEYIIDHAFAEAHGTYSVPRHLDCDSARTLPEGLLEN